MTKREALIEFREYVLPGIRRMYEQDGRIDGPARSQAWCDFTDGLHIDGRITRRQVDTWTNPF